LYSAHCNYSTHTPYPPHPPPTHSELSHPSPPISNSHYPPSHHHSSSMDGSSGISWYGSQTMGPDDWNMLEDSLRGSTPTPRDCNASNSSCSSSKLTSSPLSLSTYSGLNDKCNDNAFLIFQISFRDRLRPRCRVSLHWTLLIFSFLFHEFYSFHFNPPICSRK